MQEEKVLRVALYCRVSSEEQAKHGASLAAQEDALVAHAKEKRYKVIGIYRDEGCSARKPATKRPVMLKLLADIEQGRIDRVCFIKLDRWFRNIKEFYKVQDILDRHKVTWEATLENYSTASADERFKVNIMLSVAENEADRDSERIRFAFNSKLHRKEAYFPNVPLGYKIEKIDGVRRVVKDPVTEPMVNEFFRIALAYTVRHAVKEIEEHYDIKKCKSSWDAMARNELYTGTLKGVEGFCPAYITKEQFAELTSRGTFRTPQQDRVYLFAGLIVCPVCGKRLTSKSTRTCGKEYYYYRCADHTIDHCTYKHQVSELAVEKFLLENIKKELEQYIITAEAKPVVSKKPKKSNVEKLNERLRRINNAYFDGNMDDDEYAAKVRDIKKELEKAREEEVQEAPVDLDALRAFLASDFETIYATLGKKEKRRLWRSVISSISVSGLRPTGIEFKA